MVDILRTGLSGLVASQRALATTSHNIANVNTPGYSRQRAELTTNRLSLLAATVARCTSAPASMCNRLRGCMTTS
jgi:flagellar hook-associated protein FlgK